VGIIFGAKKIAERGISIDKIKQQKPELPQEKK